MAKILPIVAYGNPVLKRVAKDIDEDYEGLKDLIEVMHNTMYEAQGVGLAAPQIGKSIRLFIIDAAPFVDEEDEEDEEGLADFKQVFINAEILEETGEEWEFSEGCLSIPGIREGVMREPKVLISYQDENFEEHEEWFEGTKARIIQHEYDHIEGVLFTDKLNPLRRRMLKGKLNDISKGKVDIGYRMKFPLKKGK